MFNIEEQKDTSKVFKLSNPVVFVSTRLWGPENVIIKLIRTRKETRSLFKNLSYRMHDFSVICGVDLKCTELAIMYCE